ncbi:hypothetical protein Angca_004936, partial [Angiostrongylus cantonensis]
ALETARNIFVVCGEGRVGESTVRTWLRKFRSGDFDLEDKEGHGQPNEHDDDELKALVETNTQKAVREIAEQLDVGRGKISTHFNYIGKAEKLDKWVLHE